MRTIKIVSADLHEGQTFKTFLEYNDCYYPLEIRAGGGVYDDRYNPKRSEVQGITIYGDGKWDVIVVKIECNNDYPQEGQKYQFTVTIDELVIFEYLEED